MRKGYLGVSFSWGKRSVANYLKKIFPYGSPALDIGAGAGNYHFFLGNHFNMDAIEIFEPTIKAAELELKYRTVFCTDIRNFIYTINYDLIIMGDIIEHLPISDAQEVIKEALNHCLSLLVAVPYLYKQGQLGGNIHEIHIQDDLTPILVKERYPSLSCLINNEVYGYYLANGKLRNV